MNTLKRALFSLAALLLLSGVSLALPVAAHGQDSSDSSTTDSIPPQAENKGLNMAAQFKEQAKNKLQAERLKLKTRNETDRQKACTARKASLTRRMGNAVTQAEKHQAVFDAIYTRVKAFYVKKNLNVPDYSTLTGKVDTAQANAQASIAALNSLDINIDCSSQTVADSVSAFQSAVQSARDSLKTYRAALVDLINSLKGASTGTNSSNDTNSTTNQ